MGTYLLIIAFVDWQYRGIYFRHDSEWRSSSMCSFAGFISTFSSELSVFTLTGLFSFCVMSILYSTYVFSISIILFIFLTVITLDRFLVIIFPFRTHRLEMNRTRFLMSIGWVLAALISVVPLPFLRIDYFQWVNLSIWRVSLKNSLGRELSKIEALTGQKMWLFFKIKKCKKKFDWYQGQNLLLIFISILFKICHLQPSAPNRLNWLKKF